MYQPETYGVALVFMIVSMLGWGSWANMMKLTPKWPFQAFYWDYVIGILLGSLIWGFTLGSMGSGDGAFTASIAQADAHHIVFAVAAGVVFNIANLLLVSAIEIAGLAVAFPIGIGLALIVGVLLNYLIAPNGDPGLLIVGVLLVTIAIALDAFAFRLREQTHKSVSARGIQISIVAGILMGLFYPLVTHSLRGVHSLGPYSVTFFFAIGVAICSIPLNAYLMRRPPASTEPVDFRAYWNAKRSFHLWGICAGIIWCTGAVFSFVASNARIVGPATSYALGQCATMVSAAWGVLVWKEFASAPRASRRLIPWMFLAFLMGLGALALAPVFHLSPRML
jgi:glucose uptake protein